MYVKFHLTGILNCLDIFKLLQSSFGELKILVANFVLRLAAFHFPDLLQVLVSCSLIMTCLCAWTFQARVFMFLWQSSFENDEKEGIRF